MKNLSLGIQTLQKIRDHHCIYVDKTECIYNIIKKGCAYFLSRPRRFGKSLLVDTFKEYFLGNKELFQDTFIYDKIDENNIHPIILLDFANISYKELGLKDALIKKLKNIGNTYAVILE